jgi:hypothetical protein
MEYDVPRALDVPDRIGVPGFTTAQLFWAVAGIAAAVLLGREGGALLPGPWRVFLGGELVAASLALPRAVGASGWTVYRVAVARLGRWLRPRRTIWRPD